MPKLFSKFTSKSYQGTGLGLFISKSIVEAHGGKIWAENNTHDKGATFTFSIPLNSGSGSVSGSGDGSSSSIYHTRTNRVNL